jgi:hypothetical protein
MKLALCFLIIEQIECESVWAEWLKGNEDKVLIFIHSKHKFKPTTDFFRTQSHIVETVPTSWGGYGLVEATLKLFENALDFSEENMRLILVSETTVPVKKFQYVYNFLSNDGRSFIFECEREQRFPRYLNIAKTLRHNCVAKHSQWIILNRRHVQILLNASSTIERIYSKIWVPDESWALTFLNYLNESEDVCIDLITTYVNWTKKNIGSPYTFSEIPMDLFKKILLEPSYLFARKFVSDSKIIIDSETSIDFASTLTSLLA